MAPPSRRLAALAFAAALSLGAVPARAQEKTPPTKEAREERQDTTPPESAPVPARVDSILRRLRALEGYIATEYAGERAIYRADEGVLRLLGKPVVTRDETRLAAQDSIVYRDSAQFVEAYGRPEVTGQAQDLEAEVLFYDLEARRATALGASTQVTEQATWYVRGDVTLEEAQRVFATAGTFTTDDRPEPQYHFESDRIMVIRDRVLVARPARLYFGKVPVLWLPFVLTELAQGRRSGVLTPEFGVNDIVRNSSSYTREISNIGYYWAINEYLGAQLAGAWRSETFTSLRGTVDFNWRRKFLRGTATAQQYWESDGNQVRSLQGNAGWKPGERTDLAMSADYASSSRFLRDVSTDPRQVTQELSSTLRVNRRFDWGTMALGATRRQNVSDNSVTGTLPSFAVNPKTFTLFRSTNPANAAWYNDASLQASLRGSRSFRSGVLDFETGARDEDVLDLSGGIQQFSIGKLVMSATGDLRQQVFQGAEGLDVEGSTIALPTEHRDRAGWRGSVSYQQSLIGQTMLSPTVSLSRELRRDTLTDDRYLGAPVRMSVGAGLSTAVFGFFPGVGDFTAIRHRLTPTVSYSYSPEIQQSEVQASVFGKVGGRAQNRVSLTLSQSWEAKRPARPESGGTRRTPPPDSTGAPADTTAAEVPDTTAAPADSTAGAQEPPEDEKVLLLSVNTSPLEYDFIRAAEEGNGFVTERVSNSINSDYLRGLNVRMEHELFDRRDLDPNDPESRESMGRFAPRLSSLSTSFNIGPNTGFVRWIGGRLGIAGDSAAATRPSGAPGAGTEEDPEAGQPRPGGGRQDPGLGGARAGGPWRVDLDYRFSRPSRQLGRPGVDEAVQTLGARMSFSLTENWSLNWTTDYSITDREFGTHRLVLRRDLYRWEADFSFTMTPYGNSAFNMLVRLKDQPDIKFDYRERNMGIDDRGDRR